MTDDDRIKVAMDLVQEMGHPERVEMLARLAHMLRHSELGAAHVQAWVDGELVLDKVVDEVQVTDLSAFGAQPPGLMQ